MHNNTWTQPNTHTSTQTAKTTIPLRHFNVSSFVVLACVCVCMCTVDICLCVCTTYASIAVPFAIAALLSFSLTFPSYSLSFTSIPFATLRARVLSAFDGFGSVCFDSNRRPAIVSFRTLYRTFPLCSNVTKLCWIEKVKRFVFVLLVYFPISYKCEHTHTHTQATKRQKLRRF